MSNEPTWSEATLCAHAGAPDHSTSSAAPPRSHVSPIYQHSVFDFRTIPDSVRALGGDGYVYRRLGLPNTDELGAAVAALEGAQAGYAAGSGMAAIAAAVLGHCRAGDAVALQRDAYGGTPALFQADLERFGIELRRVDAYDPAAFADAVRGARLAIVESIANPLLHELDLERCGRACRDAGALLVVDNTFATPLRTRPLERGADIVVHSVTKFLAGHHDLCAGAVVGNDEVVAAARGVASRMGLDASPFDAWLAVRGLRTLEVRMRRAWQTAAEIAERLRGHGGVARVFSARDCALVSFDTGSRERAERVVERCAIITLSPSLGGVTTTLAHPATSSHATLGEAARNEAGITDGLLRISVGIESVDDVWNDLQRGLE